MLQSLARAVDLDQASTGLAAGVVVPIALRAVNDDLGSLKTGERGEVADPF